jgi:hypothetical protein
MPLKVAGSAGLLLGYQAGQLASGRRFSGELLMVVVAAKAPPTEAFGMPLKVWISPDCIRVAKLGS